MGEADGEGGLGGDGPGAAAEPGRIETARLVLRLHTRADFAAMAAMWADPAVVGPIGVSPQDEAASWARLLRYRGLWPLLGYGYWAISEGASGRYVGDIGFADFHRRLSPCIHGIPEAGWALARWAQGQGFAREALRAALGWLDGQTAHRRVVCIVGPDNAASLTLAGACGFALACSARHDGRDVLLLERFRAPACAA